MAVRVDAPVSQSQEVEPPSVNPRGAAMPKTTLTITFTGDVPLDLFSDGMRYFRQLIDALTQEVSQQAGIVWLVEDLSGGSTVATIRGEADKAEEVERVVRAYATVGRALERNEVIPYSPQVVRAAERITTVLNGRVTSIQFEALDEVAIVTTGEPGYVRPVLGAYGSVEGRIETLSSRRRLRFTLYDSLKDQAISCLLQPEQTELVRDAWGRRAIVRGWIKRDPTSGRPTEINPVQAIDILPEVVPGAYRKARAIAPANLDEPSPEDAIRRLRDA